MRRAIYRVGVGPAARPYASRWWLFLPVLLLSGCGDKPILSKHWPDAYWHNGPYYLIAIDSEEQMSLEYDMGGFSNLDNLVGQTVFAVGANEGFVVAKQHPRDVFSHFAFNRGRTNYFIVDRATERPGRKPRVVGPLTRAQFDSVSQSADLPEFSKTFRKLEWKRTE
jgi:hypothetical protein